MSVTWRGVGAAAVLGAVFAAGMAAGAAAQAGQSRREPQFDSERVRAWKSIIMPNQPISLHRHDHGRAIVALKGGTLDIVDAEGRTERQETWETGRAYWFGADPPGTRHADLNRTSEPIEVIVVELKDPGAM